MKIKKANNTYNVYNVELSFGQLQALRNALASSHDDPISDEMYAAISWYLDNLPGPGESEEDIKKSEEAEESGMADKDAGELQPSKPDINDLLPSPGEGGEEVEGEEEVETEEAPGGRELPGPKEFLGVGAEERLPAPPAA